MYGQSENKHVHSITKEELKTLKLHYNTVLIRPERANDELKLSLKGTKEEIKLFVDTQFNPHQHACVRGVVVAIGPLRYNRKLPCQLGGSLAWDTDQECEIGDLVIYRHYNSANAIDLGHLLLVDGMPHLFINYQNIFGVVYSNDVKPINGFVFVEPVLEKDIIKTNAIILPELVALRPQAKYARVQFVGTPIRQYHATENDGSSAYTDEDHLPEIHPGDLVVLEPNSDVPLEYDIHSTISKSVLYRVQRRNILAIINEEAPI